LRWTYCAPPACGRETLCDETPPPGCERLKAHDERRGACTGPVTLCGLARHGFAGGNHGNHGNRAKPHPNKGTHMVSHIGVGVGGFAPTRALCRALMPVLGIQERFCEPACPWAGGR